MGRRVITMGSRITLLPEAKMSLVLSIRRVITGYTGYAMRIRRSSDNAETELEYDNTGVISSNSPVSAGGTLSAWMGSSNIYVRIWYDQTGIYDMSCAIAASQPRLYLTGGGNSKPYIAFDGTDDYLENATPNIFSTHNSGDFFNVVRFPVTDNALNVITSTDYSQDNTYVSYGKSSVTRNNSLRILKRYSLSEPTTNVYGNISVNTGNWHQFLAGSIDTAYRMRIDKIDASISVSGGSNDGDWFAQTGGRDGLNLSRLKRLSGSSYNQFDISELIYYSPYITAAEITDTENYIASFYSL